MKSLIPTFVCACVTLASVPTYAAVAKEPTSEEMAQAKELYDEGRKAYRLGDMSTAVKNFEGAYEITENPIILYNIGLGYRRLYEESQDPAHLRRAKLVLENFRLELARDSGLGSPDEVKAVLTEVESLLEKSEEEQAEADAAAAAAAQSSEEEQEPEGPSAGEQVDVPENKEGKTFRLIGIGLMAGGGAALVGGAVGVGISAAARSDQMSQLDASKSNASDDGCPGSDPLCAEYDNQQKVINENIKATENNMIISGVVGGVGLAALGAGVAMFLIGQKKGKEGAMANLRISPTYGGAVLSGRF